MCLESLERAGTAAAPPRHRGQVLSSAGDALLWSEPGGDTYLCTPLEMLAGAQLSCVCAVKVLSSASLRWDLLREGSSGCS